MHDLTSPTSKLLRNNKMHIQSAFLLQRKYQQEKIGSGSKGFRLLLPDYLQ